MLGTLAGLAALGVAGYLGSRLCAQQPAATPPAAAPAQIRIALINFPQVIQSYQKFKLYQDELKKVVDGYQAQDDKLRAEMLRGKEALENTKNPLTAQQREQWEAALTNLKRQREDLSAKAKKDVGTQSSAQFVQLYKEVEDAVSRYAQSQGFHVVLQYSEAFTAADRYTPGNIQRKLEGGACMPIYAAGGIDISTGVANLLNSMYQANAAARPAAATAPAAPAAAQPRQ
jgi:Skp family chaperone for outer membrane proteins